MAGTSSAVKNRWNEKAYDRIAFFVPKGKRDLIKEHAARSGESVNALINRLIDEDMQKSGE